jgi:hypothetical protein
VTINEQKRKFSKDFLGISLKTLYTSQDEKNAIRLTGIIGTEWEHKRV